MPTYRSCGKKPEAEAMIASLKMAIEQYESTYSAFPFTPGSESSDLSSDKDNGEVSDDSDDFRYAALLDCLSASDTNGHNGSDVLNPRRIKFLEIETDGTYEDPWENDYAVVLDSNRNGYIDASRSPTGKRILQTIIIFSGGKDGDLTTTDDNVNSWDDYKYGLGCNVR